MIGRGGYYIGTTELSSVPKLQNSYEWTVDQPSGTSMIFQVTDANGEVGYVQNVGVGESGDGSCLAGGIGNGDGNANGSGDPTGSSGAGGSETTAAGDDYGAEAGATASGSAAITSSSDDGYVAPGEYPPCLNRHS